MKYFLSCFLCACCSIFTFGQTLVKDINIGGGGSDPCDFAKLGNLTFFVANDGEHGYELWVTDGTDAGTSLVKDINPGFGDGLLYTSLTGFKYPQIQALGKYVYFFANDGEHGFELWRSDGTQIGTTLVKDILPGAASSNTSLVLLRLDSLLIFPADDGVNGAELWRSNGTDTGTYMIKDFYPGPGSADPQCFFADSCFCYFAANNGVDGYGLCRTNGTDTGTVYISNVAPTPAPGDSCPFIKFDGQIYFNGLTLNDGAELWKTDGTREGTKLVKELRPGVSSGSPSQFAVCRSCIAFTAEGDENNARIWTTDSGGISTALLMKVSKRPRLSHPSGLTALDTLLFFTALDTGGRTQLYVSNITDSGTILFADTNAAGPKFADPKILFNTGHAIYFSCSRPETGTELWVTSGSLAGTHMVPEICPGPCSSSPCNFYKSNTSLYFAASDIVHGRELWQLNGETTLLQEITDGGSKDVYTDPLRKELYRISQTGNDITYLKVFDLEGHELLTQDIKTPIPVSVTTFAPGIYLIRTYDKNDRPVSFTRFVKQ